MTLPGDEPSKAIAEAAKVAGQALTVLQSAGAYIADILGTAPQDVVAFLGGNWLRVKRAEQLAVVLENSRERLRARGIEPEPASLSLAIPLLEAAADEGREPAGRFMIRSRTRVVKRHTRRVIGSGWSRKTIRPTVQPLRGVYPANISEFQLRGREVLNAL